MDAMSCKLILRLVVAAIIAAGTFSAPAAAAHEGTHQPTPKRLECQTAEADPSACREYRWIMRPRVHIGPHGYVRYMRDLQPCGEYVGSVEEQADAIQPATNCFWNHKRRGGGEPGESYVDLGRGWFMIVNGFRLGHRA